MSQSSPSALPPNFMCDVLVVGYGPVGMTCAALLAQRGLDVIAVERHPERYQWHRAGHFDGEIMRVFQRLGVAETVELAAQPLISMEMISAEGEVLSRVESGQNGSGWKSDYLAYQPDYERAVDGRGRKLGVRFLGGVRAAQLTQGDHGVRTLVHPDEHPDSECVITSKYVIGADGANSFVREAIGAERIDLGFEAEPQLVIDFEFSDPDCELPGMPDNAHILDYERPGMVGRWGGRRHTRFQFSARGKESRELLQSEEFCWSLIGRWGLVPEHGKIIRRAVYDFESSVTTPWRQRRVLLMGDAAHTMPPHMGQGMQSGIRDAENLAWKLAAVLTGTANDILLETYQTEREPHVRALIEMSSRLGRAVLVSNREQARQRDEMLRSGNQPKGEFPRLTQGIVRAPGAAGALEAPGGDGRPGLQARVVRGTRADRLDNFASRQGWRIVSRHPVPRELFNGRQLRLLESLDMDFFHISRGANGDVSLWDIDGEYERWYASTGRRIFLERPDHYVFGTATTLKELPALVDELADALASNGWLAAQDGDAAS